jgi:isopenicillin-N N-acyltransferase like protein
VAQLARAPAVDRPAGEGHGVAMSDGGLRIVEVAGSPRELGRGHGEELRFLIARGLDGWFAQIGRATGVVGPDFVARLLEQTRFVPSIDELTPELNEEIQGLAEGSAQPYSTMLAYQLMDEEWWFRTSLGRSRQSPVEACSAVGVLRADGTTLMAQNMDLPSFYDGTQVLLRLRPAGRPEALVFSPAGMLGTTGLNDAGVAVCCNSLPQLSHRPSGLPVAFIVRAVLAQPSLAAAADLVRTVPHSTGQNYLIGDPSGITDLEASANQVRTVEPDGAQVRHTNHPLTNDDVSVASGTAAEIRSTTRARLDKVTHDIGPLGAAVTVADLARVLSDSEVPVCVPRGAGWMTLGSLVMELSTNPVLHIAPGPPVETPYVTVRFDA